MFIYKCIEIIYIFVKVNLLDNYQPLIMKSTKAEKPKVDRDKLEKSKAAKSKAIDNNTIIRK